MYKCKVCNKEFSELPGKYATGDYCSKECAKRYSSLQNKNKTKILTCRTCNKEFEAPNNAGINSNCPKCRKIATAAKKREYQLDHPEMIKNTYIKLEDRNSEDIPHKKEDKLCNCKIHGETLFSFIPSSNLYKCKKCNAEKVAERRRQVKLKAIEYKGGKCEMCGYNKCVNALEFHHLDPSQKEFNIGKKGATRKWENVQKELDKCILLCANCHRELHDTLNKNKQS